MGQTACSGKCMTTCLGSADSSSYSWRVQAKTDHESRLKRHYVWKAFDVGHVPQLLLSHSFRHVTSYSVL